MSFSMVWSRWVSWDVDEETGVVSLVWSRYRGPHFEEYEVRRRVNSG